MGFDSLFGAQNEKEEKKKKPTHPLSVALLQICLLFSFYAN